MVEGDIIAGRHLHDRTTVLHFPEKKPTSTTATLSTSFTLAELITLYQQDILPRKQPETQERERYYHRFWNKTLGQKLLTDIAKVDIVKVRNDFLAKGYKATSIQRYLMVLSHLLNTAIRDYDLLTVNVVNLIQKPPLPPGRIRYLSDDERSRLLAECRRSKNQRLYALVILALSTGLRSRNLYLLQRRHIDLDQRIITVARTKNGLPLVLPLVGEAVEVVNHLCQQVGQDDYLFPHVNALRPRNSYIKSFEYALQRAGIEDASFHTLRHTAASYLIQSGVDIYTVSRILNHKSITMTARYAHLQLDNLKDALTTLSQRLSS